MIKSRPWAGRLQPTGLRWLAACFCMACNLSMVFAFWNGWLKIKRRVLFCDMWETREIQIFMSTITFYWRPAISFVFLYCQWLLLHSNESWVVVTEMALKAPNVYYLALYGKKLANLCCGPLQEKYLLASWPDGSIKERRIGENILGESRDNGLFTKMKRWGGGVRRWGREALEIIYYE